MLTFKKKRYKVTACIYTYIYFIYYIYIIFTCVMFYIYILRYIFPNIHDYIWFEYERIIKNSKNILRLIRICIYTYIYIYIYYIYKDR